MTLWFGAHTCCARHSDSAGEAVRLCAPSTSKISSPLFLKNQSNLTLRKLACLFLWLQTSAQKSDTSYVVLQAHSDALGSWGDNGAAARRAWEGDGRIDLRSVTNCLRQLPYHVAWQKGFRQAAGVLNPTVPIDSALETCRELGEGQHTLSGLVDMLLDCLCNARSFVCDAKQGVPRHNSCLASFLLVSYLQCKVRRDVKVV